MFESWSSDSLGALCAFGSSFTWAVGSATYSRLNRNYSAFSVNFTRAAVACPLFIFAAFLVSGGIEGGLFEYKNIRLSHCGWLTLSMVVSYGLGDVLFLKSARFLGVPGALAIGSSYPIWTVLVGFLYAGERITRFQILGLLVTFLGIVMVILNGPKSGRQSSIKLDHKVSWKGIGLAGATSLAWGINCFAVSRVGTDIIPPVGNSIRMLIGMVITLGLGRVFAPQEAILLPLKKIYPFVAIFILEAFVGSYLYMYGLTHAPLALGTTLSSLSPVISVPAAVIFGIERFSILRTLGVFFAVIGVSLILGGL